MGYLCGRCGGWNGPEPNEQGQKPSIKDTATSSSKDNKPEKGIDRARDESDEASESNQTGIQEKEVERVEKPQE